MVDRFKNKVKKMAKERSSKDSLSSMNMSKKESVLKLFMPAPLIQNTLTLAKKLKS